MNALQNKNRISSLIYEKAKIEKKNLSNVAQIENEIYSLNELFDHQKIFKIMQQVLPNQIQIYKCADIFNYVTEVRKEIDVETKNIQNKIKKHKFFDEFLIKLKLIINIFLTIELISACLASFFPTFSVLASRSYTNNELMASLEIFAIMLLVIFIVNLILFLINNIVCKVVWNKVVNKVKMYFDNFEKVVNVKYMNIFKNLKDQIIFPYFDSQNSNTQSSEE